MLVLFGIIGAYLPQATKFVRRGKYFENGLFLANKGVSFLNCTQTDSYKFNALSFAQNAETVINSFGLFPVVLGAIGFIVNVVFQSIKLCGGITAATNV